MNNKQRLTLAKIFEQPERADIPWSDIEKLFEALGAEVTEGKGSRVRVAFKGKKQCSTDRILRRRQTSQPFALLKDFLKKQG